MIRAIRDPRFLGIAVLVTSVLVGFNFFISESFLFRVLFTSLFLILFLLVDLVTMTVSLPYSTVTPEDARKSRSILLFASPVVVLGLYVVSIAINH